MSHRTALAAALYHAINNAVIEYATASESSHTVGALAESASFDACDPRSPDACRWCAIGRIIKHLPEKYLPIPGTGAFSALCEQFGFSAASIYAPHDEAPTSTADNRETVLQAMQRLAAVLRPIVTEETERKHQYTWRVYTSLSATEKNLIQNMRSMRDELNLVRKEVGNRDKYIQARRVSGDAGGYQFRVDPTTQRAA